MVSKSGNFTIIWYGTFTIRKIIYNTLSVLKINIVKFIKEL